MTSCNHLDLDQQAATVSQDTEAINDNASTILGDIDPNHNWSSITSGSVTIQADAAMSDIAKVQILTESPFMNSGAKVLSESRATNGQSVVLTYDAPNNYTELVAACVSSDGEYYITTFVPGASAVSFQSAVSQPVARRASAASYSFPDISNFYLPDANTFRSYNAIRSLKAASGAGAYNNSNLSLWKDKGWDKELMWRLSGEADNTVSYNNGWEVRNYSLRREVSGGLSDAEKAELQTIFSNYLSWSKGKDQQLNNLEKIRGSKYVELYQNQFTTTGDPVILTPVQSTSCDMKYCDLYYYYYNPEAVKGMTEAEQLQYIKDLPKYMAMNCKEAMLNTNGVSDFYKKYQYVLPYYGDPEDITFQSMDDYQGDKGFGFQSDKVYRIRNGYTSNGTYYLAHTNDVNSILQPLYLSQYKDDSDKTKQLWQLFSNADGQCYLYNVGMKSFLYNDVNGWQVIWSTQDYLNRDVIPYILVPTGKGFVIRSSVVGNKALGSDLNKNGNQFNTGVWADKWVNNETCRWYLEEYTGSDVEPMSSLQKVVQRSAKSYAIPKGYKVGMLLKKSWNSGGDEYNFYQKKTFDHDHNGEVFADGRLNVEINNFPNHFSKSSSDFTMEDDDPRAAIFSANKKTYLTLEDGQDCNYVDMIIEISDGIETIFENIDVEAEAYTMCFEDRPLTADYDLNDLVLRCVRKDATTLTLSLVACGANDDIVIHGATGWAYNNKEVHESFGATAKDDSGNRFVNTVANGTTLAPLSADVTVAEGVSVSTFLQQIWLENKSTGKVIQVAKQGDAPFAIIIPRDFNYPLEKTSIVSAYSTFKDWAQDSGVCKDWYVNDDETKTYSNPFAN